MRRAVPGTGTRTRGGDLRVVVVVVVLAPAVSDSRKSEVDVPSTRCTLVAERPPGARNTVAVTLGPEECFDKSVKFWCGEMTGCTRRGVGTRGPGTKPKAVLGSSYCWCHKSRNYPARIGTVGSAALKEITGPMNRVVGCGGLGFGLKGFGGTASTLQEAKPGSSPVFFTLLALVLTDGAISDDVYTYVPTTVGFPEEASQLMPQEALANPSFAWYRFPYSVPQLTASAPMVSIIKKVTGLASSVVDKALKAAGSITAKPESPLIGKSGTQIIAQPVVVLENATMQPPPPVIYF
ncbi:hypothetical protein MRX96_009173 [Rhipicephalus microplus]